MNVQSILEVASKWVLKPFCDLLFNPPQIFGGLKALSEVERKI
jgi:hypothetical protein